MIDINEAPAYVIGTYNGIMILGPQTNDFPITQWIPKKEIRIVEAEPKLLTSFVRIKTNDKIHVIKTDKKNFKAIEKMINLVRNL